MSENELEKVNLIIDKLEKIVCSFKGKNYDFTKFLISDNFFDDFVFKLDNLEEEKVKQDKMMNCVKNVFQVGLKSYFKQMVNEGKIYDSFDKYFESIVRVEDCGNYYILWLSEVPYMNANFVFDKNGNLLFDNRVVCGLDNNNFVLLDYDIKEMSEKLYHYQFNDSKFELVNTIDNVIDIDYSDFFSSDLVICSGCENRILYNYRNKEVLMSNYVATYSDLGNFNNLNFIDKNKYVRVVQKIFGIEDYRSVMISKLEYLVDKNGKIAEFGVFDFENEQRYSLINRGNNQEEILNSICEEVRNNYRLDVKRKTRKQN